MKSIRIILLILMACSVIAGPALGDEDRDGTQGKDYRSITWLSWLEAKSAGRDLGRPMFLFFNAEWSPGGRVMLVETFKDPRVIHYLEDHFACCMVDATDMTALTRKYQVAAIPTLWFLDASGKALTSIDGVAKPDKLLRVLKYIKTEAYLTTEYDYWLDNEVSR